MVSNLNHKSNFIFLKIKRNPLTSDFNSANFDAEGADERKLRESPAGVIRPRAGGSSRPEAVLDRRRGESREAGAPPPDPVGVDRRARDAGGHVVNRMPGAEPGPRMIAVTGPAPWSCGPNAPTTRIPAQAATMRRAGRARTWNSSRAMGAAPPSPSGYRPDGGTSPGSCRIHGIETNVTGEIPAPVGKMARRACRRRPGFRLRRRRNAAFESAEDTNRAPRSEISEVNERDVVFGSGKGYSRP